MESFIYDDFLLQTETAKVLYHDYAEKMPIIDFHNHLSPSDTRTCIDNIRMIRGV